MGLKCLLGHDFGEREVERDRREEGDEVVVVYRTVENCRRCDTRRVVSENKEVRSIRSATAATRSAEPADAAPTADPAAPTGDRGGAPADADSAPDSFSGSLIEAAEAGGDPADDDAVILGGTDADDEVANGDATSEVTNEDAADGTDPDEGEEPTAAEDGSTAAGAGAELIDADAGDAGNGDADGVASNGAWPTPDPDAEDEGFDATAHEDAESGVDFGGGLTPTDADHAAYVGTDDGDDEDGFLRTEHRTVDDDGPTEFRCPNCGATRTARDSSLRAGDICPDCRKGYVAERAIEE